MGTLLLLKEGGNSTILTQILRNFLNKCGPFSSPIITLVVLLPFICLSQSFPEPGNLIS